MIQQQMLLEVRIILTQTHSAPRLSKIIPLTKLQPMERQMKMEILPNTPDVQIRTK